MKVLNEEESWTQKEGAEYLPGFVVAIVGGCGPIADL